MSGHSYIQTNCLLQDGVSSALATLHAIRASGLFDALPQHEADVARHNHGAALLGMLEDHLQDLQRRVDELDPVTTPPQPAVPTPFRAVADRFAAKLLADARRLIGETRA